MTTPHAKVTERRMLTTVTSLAEAPRDQASPPVARSTGQMSSWGVGVYVFWVLP
jgi:hypothetical protein